MRGLARLASLFCAIALVAVAAGCALQTQPRAEFTATPRFGYPPLDITFDAAGSTSPNGAIVGYEWAFGDGATAAGSRVTHTYTEKGIYKVVLEVQDETGRRGVRTQEVEALNHAPIAQFTANVYTTPVRQPVWFNASESYDPDGEIVAYLWDFGDGTTSEGEVVDHEYQTAGGSGWRPEITLTVIDDDGASDSASVRIIVVGCDSCGG